MRSPTTGSRRAPARATPRRRSPRRWGRGWTIPSRRALGSPVVRSSEGAIARPLGASPPSRWDLASVIESLGVLADVADVGGALWVAIRGSFTAVGDSALLERARAALSPRRGTRRADRRGEHERRPAFAGDGQLDGGLAPGWKDRRLLHHRSLRGVTPRGPRRGADSKACWTEIESRSSASQGRRRASIGRA